ncbi:hypothetical protein WJX75_003301 [Coccomyxa subellipsoidea]|uniref:Uncharacterized protein n=1 Tax=Coccomyxa subellipsoidea TaxID=248742 RepID=A0ABR2YV41_9CHLO
MIREAILVTFVAVDIYKTVANGRRKRRARRAQQDYIQQRSHSTVVAVQTRSNAAASGRTKLVSFAAFSQEKLLQLLGLCTFLAAAVLTGVALYAPDLLISAFGVCACLLLVMIAHVYATLKEQSSLALAVAAAVQSPAVAAASLQSVQNLNGIWIKDKAASDSMDPAMDLMGLNGLIRKAINLVRGVEIAITDDTFEMAIISVIPWFKVREKYPLTSEERQHRRRDLRRGGARGRVRMNPDGALRLDLAWPEPHGGTGYDLFYVLDDVNTLHVDSVITVGGRTATYNVVYRRRT